MAAEADIARQVGSSGDKVRYSTGQSILDSTPTRDERHCAVDSIMTEDADYQGYLNAIYPNTTWSLARLTGGLVNFTFRATLTSGAAPYSSLILKHARPYVAVEGPKWELTTQRQIVEAELLALWGGSGALSPQRHQGTTSTWRSPPLIRHDHGPESILHLSTSTAEASILVIADLGDLINIVEFLKLSGAGGNPTTLQRPALEQIAITVGQACAIIHSPSTAAIICARPTSAAQLTHSFTNGVEYQASVQPLRQRLEPHPDAEYLYKRVLDDFQKPKDRYPFCLTLGDFWPGSVLMNPPAPGSNLTPIIVDWEFAQIINGHGVSADVAGFLANMRCEMLLAKAEGSTGEYNALSCFVDSFCGGYREWSDLTCRKRPDDVPMQLLRSTVLVHGREMINRAYDFYRTRACFQNMVDLGRWYIERACDNVEQFVDDANWASLKREPSMMIQSLFKIN